MTHRLFVYGSLRRGESNHDRWFGRGVTPVLDGYITGAELVRLGAYCCIVPINDPARIVVGEVYDIAEDIFPGVEAMEVEAGYVRQPVDVHRASSEDGSDTIRAEAYFYEHPERVEQRPRVRSGDWTLRKRRRL